MKKRTRCIHRKLFYYPLGYYRVGYYVRSGAYVDFEMCAVGLLQWFGVLRTQHYWPESVTISLSHRRQKGWLKCWVDPSTRCIIHRVGHSIRIPWHAANYLDDLGIYGSFWLKLTIHKHR